MKIEKKDPEAQMQANRLVVKLVWVRRLPSFHSTIDNEFNDLAQLFNGLTARLATKFFTDDRLPITL
jgi:hypothetical protein